jgi:hypothetical protein
MARKIKIIFISLMCIPSIISSRIANAVSDTTWKPVEKSMSQLLSLGWKIVGHSGSRTVILPGTVSGADETIFSYILYKDGKYINCFIQNPRPNNAASSCRQLNE